MHVIDRYARLLKGCVQTHNASKWPVYILNMLSFPKLKKPHKFENLNNFSNIDIWSKTKCKHLKYTYSSFWFLKYVKNTLLYDERRYYIYFCNLNTSMWFVSILLFVIRISDCWQSAESKLVIRNFYLSVSFKKPFIYHLLIPRTFTYIWYEHTPF